LTLSVPDDGYSRNMLYALDICVFISVTSVFIVGVMGL